MNLLRKNKFLDSQIENAKAQQNRLLSNVSVLNKEEIQEIRNEARRVIEENSLGTAEILKMSDTHGGGEEESNKLQALTYE
mmetsp:Transcript_25132/g.24881  ORF Transcript_25132/g.24881 Transcript_25132/m.24881 type:complete len:81 (-) Transcript_25132:74-316(-)